MRGWNTPRLGVLEIAAIRHSFVLVVSPNTPEHV
jgi:hypothetical protein